LERFYENVVEDKLFGKDVDCTEDLRDPRTSTAGITARNQCYKTRVLETRRI
jgi:hypothetical protein